MSGISGQTALSVTGGEYSVNSAPFTALTGTIYPSDTVVLRVMSSAFPYTSTSVVLTVGGISGAFTVTTGSGIGNSNGKILSMDVCPKGDLSPSYYDGMCRADRSGTGTDITTIEGLFTGGPTDASLLSPTADPMDVRFTDIVGNWAEWYISKLATYGIVDNTELYRPDDRLTRAEFLKIATNTAGWVPSTMESVSRFEDVSTDDWYAPYVLLALSKGAITGSNAKFRPNDLITRAEATKILMAVSGTRIDELSTITFADLDLTSDLTKYIEAARSKNIISGQEVD